MIYVHGCLLFACLAITALIAAAIVTAAHGEFVYSLDDPYIHLALARGIANGFYGISPTEYSAPSSSILWPILLSLFANSDWAEWAPFAINVVCLLATASCLYLFALPHVCELRAALFSLALLLTLNLFGLVFTGMEHSLQLLLVSVVATNLSRQSGWPWPLYIALVLMPLVRYEDLAISLPILVWRLVIGERVAAAVALSIIIAAMIGFSAFLQGHGLGWLPSSVIAKQSALHGSGSDRLTQLFVNVIDNIRAMPLTVLLAAIVCIVPSRQRTDPKRALVIATATILILSFGQNGWFDRYEVHFVMFIAVTFAGIALPMLPQHIRASVWLLPAVFVVLATAPGYLWKSTILTPTAAANIAEQQAQMADLVRNQLRAPVAVNDLGLVAWRGGQPVLDLWGLASIEALRARLADSSGDWLDSLVASNQVEFVMIYDTWFPNRPSNWTKIAELHLLGPRRSAGHSIVSFYGTSPDAANRLRQAVVAQMQASPLAAQTFRLVPAEFVH